MVPASMKRVGGWEFPSRPPGKGVFHSDQQRAYAIVEALRVAAESCRESQRALYELILPALAAAQTLKESLKHEVIQLTLDEAAESAGSSPAAWS